MGRLTEWWAAASVIVIRLKSQLLKASCHSSEDLLPFPTVETEGRGRVYRSRMALPKQAFHDKLGLVVELLLSQRLLLFRRASL